MLMGVWASLANLWRTRPCLQRTTRRHREAMESYLVRQLSYVSDSAGCAGAAFRLLRAAGVVPTAGLLDLLGLAVGYRPHLLKVMIVVATLDHLLRLDRLLGLAQLLFVTVCYRVNSTC